MRKCANISQYMIFFFISMDAIQNSKTHVQNTFAFKLAKNANIRQQKNLLHRFKVGIIKGNMSSNPLKKCKKFTSIFTQ
jgi:hypothetical protein